MGFVRFTEKGRSYTAKVSLSRTGMLSFNNGAMTRFGMDKFAFGVLYYDAETKKIGLELTRDENAEGAKKLRQRKTGTDVSAKSFVDFFNIGVKETQIYDVEKDEEGDMLVIDMTKSKPRGATIKKNAPSAE